MKRGWTVLGLAGTGLLALVIVPAVSYLALEETIVNRFLLGEFLPGYGPDVAALQDVSKEEVQRVFRLGLLAYAISLTGLAGLAWYWHPLTRRASTQSFLELLCFVLCSFVLLSTSYYQAQTAVWYDLGQLISAPATVPIFGTRMLFVWISQASVALVPGLSSTKAYLLSQAVAIPFALVALRIYVTGLVGREAVIPAWLVAVVFLVPTFSYRTFYDVAIVGFFALGLHFLSMNRHAAFAATIGVGTLNHENILLLVPIAVASLMVRGKRPWCLTLLCLAVYAATRITMEVMYPVSDVYSMKVWRNFLFLDRREAQVLPALLWLALAGGVLISCYRSSSQFVRVSFLLLPLLVAVTFLFGQFNESRQYVAIIPVLSVAICQRLFRATGPRDPEAPGFA